jgi:hypothetical protein
VKSRGFFVVFPHLLQVMQNYIYKKKPKSFYTGTHTPTYVGTCICAEEGDKNIFGNGGRRKWE